MHIKNVLLRGRGELFLAPKSFPSPPQTPPLPSKRALQKQANDQPAIGKAVPTGAKAFRLPGCDLAQRKRARENEQHRHSEAGLQKDSSRDKIIGPCTRSPLPQAARSVMPCPCRPVVRGCRRSCERERERTEEGAGRHSLHRSESAVSIPQDGNRNGSNLPCGRPPPLLPGLCPKNAKRPPCGGPCILFPHPAGAGHGHRNYSALSALAGASVLASGRRVSSMMAMGALSPLRGMASFITRV